MGNVPDPSNIFSIEENQMNYISILLAPFKWIGKGISFFLSLDISVQLSIILAISLLCNLWQLNHAHNLKARAIISVNAEKNKCIEQNKKAEQEAMDIHTSRQQIWNLFVENAKNDTNVKLQSLKKDQEKVRIIYEKVKIENPLPVNCQFANPVVLNANEALRNALN